MAAETVTVDGITMPVVRLDPGSHEHLLGYTTSDGLRGYVETKLVYRLEAYRPEPKKQAWTRIFYLIGSTCFTIEAKEPIEELAAEWERRRENTLQ